MPPTGLHPGPVKDMIVTGVENVYSGEVEAAICNHPAVREAAVFGNPDPQWGELVAACVVLKPNMQLTEGELIQHCPKSGSGKVLKRVLRERFRAGADRAV